MGERRYVTITLYDGEQYDNDWPPTGAAEFMAWLADKLVAVPPEFMCNATVEIGSSRDYDSSAARMEVSWWRPETDEEMTAREASEAAQQQTRARVAEINERQMLAALKAKYGE